MNVDPLAQFHGTEAQTLMPPVTQTESVQTQQQMSSPTTVQMTMPSTTEVVPQMSMGVAPPSTGIPFMPERTPSIKVPFFMSKMYIPLDDNHVTYVVQSLLKQHGIKDDDFIIRLHTSYYTGALRANKYYDGTQRMNRLQDLFVNAGMKCEVVDSSHQFSSDENGRIKPILLWSGSDDDVPLVMDNMGFRRIKYAWKLVDPKMGSMWSHMKDVDAICVATNGCFKLGQKEAYAICGRGSALQASIFMPTFKVQLGNKLKQFANNEWGNDLFRVGSIDDTDLIAFPSKPRSVIVNADKSNVAPWMRDRCSVGEQLPGYRAKASVELINFGFSRLAKLIEERNYKSVLLPLVGCGSGALDWARDIVPILRSNTDINPYLNRLFVGQFGNGRTPITSMLP